jgi:hypothetical protein
MGPLEARFSGRVSVQRATRIFFGLVEVSCGDDEPAARDAIEYQPTEMLLRRHGQDKSMNSSCPLILLMVCHEFSLWMHWAVQGEQSMLSPR